MLNSKMQMRKKMLDNDARKGSLQMRKREAPGDAPEAEGEEVGDDFVQMMVTPEEKQMILDHREENGEPTEESDDSADGADFAE